MAIILKLTEVPYGSAFFIWDDMSQTIFPPGADSCETDGSNITSLPGGGQHVSGCAGIAREFALELIVGDKYMIKSVGDAPVTMTLFSFDGILPEKFTFSSFSSWGTVGNPAFPAWHPGNMMEIGCDELSIGESCLFELSVGVGEGTFYSATLHHVVSEPSSVALLAVALMGGLIYKRLWRREIGVKRLSSA
jgi:hypothetical protein